MALVAQQTAPMIKIQRLTVPGKLISPSPFAPAVRLSPATSTGLGGSISANAALTASSLSVTASPNSTIEAIAAQRQTLLFAALSKLKFDRRPSMILRTWADLQSTSATSVGGRPAAPQPQLQPPTAAASMNPSMMPMPQSDAPPKPYSVEKMASIDAVEFGKMTAAAEQEAQLFSQLVTVGKWEEAGQILRKLKVANQTTIFNALLSQLSAVRRDFQQLSDSSDLVGTPVNNQQFFERNSFTLDDLTGVLALAPKQLARSEVSSIGMLLSTTIENGVVKEALDSHLQALVSQTPDADADWDRDSTPLVTQVNDDEEYSLEIVAQSSEVEVVPQVQGEADSAKPLQPWITRRQAAWLLIYAGQLDLVETYLPTAQQCQTNQDAEGMNIIARLYIQKSSTQEDEKFLNKAWNIIQLVIQAKDVPAEDKNEALLRAVALAPRIEKEIGQAWLNDLFKNNIDKSKEVLAVIGERASRGLQSQPFDVDGRAQTLEMMKTATDSLLAQNPEQAKQWKDLLNLLASTWLREAKFTQERDTSKSLGPQLQRDNYGNFFYNNFQMQMQQNTYQGGNQPRPVTTERILDTIPEGAWFDAIDDSLKPEISIICANLLLKVDEDQRAFPYIEALAKTHKEKAQELAEQFLRVWTLNHDMNSSRGDNRYSPYYFSYGFNQSAESIPLTRSKQERNLVDLTKWMVRLRALPGIEVDQELLANAFTTCHSGAEIYRFEEIEKVFGPMAEMDPNVLAALSDKMRSNLLEQWRKPDVQKQSKTRRGKKDIQAEVLRGYQLAQKTVDQALTKHPGNWRLLLQKACLTFDDNEYQSVLKTRSDYSTQKTIAYNLFKNSAAAYQGQIDTMKTTDYSVEVFEKWFYAMLGATDLAKVNHEQVAQTNQTKLIAEAIGSLGDKVSKKHLSLFANVVVTRVGTANPAVKFAFLEEGFKITGDMSEVSEARRLHEYYQDLVVELELAAIIDGTDEISPDQPFGVFVQINHTPEIERESGGFGRFLQNQGSMFSPYNFGRPTEDYRDKFEEAARSVLNEHFEVLGVTFQRETVRSRTLQDREGWKMTPYAYMLLKPRSTEVDRLPSIKMDLDFLDTTGYVVLPIRTAETPLAYAGKKAEPRPFQNLKVTQTLDQREGGEGKLTLEVKAVCLGLVPSLEEILDLKPSEFEVAESVDSGSMVVNFDKDSEDVVVLSERTWDIKLKGRADLTTKPDRFEFATAKIDLEEMSLMGFEDEDLKALEPVIELKGNYGNAATPWGMVITIASIGLLGLVVVSMSIIAMTKSLNVDDQKTSLVDITPFGLVSALEKRWQSDELDSTKQAELRQEIQELEAKFFSAGSTNSKSGQKNPANSIPEPESVTADESPATQTSGKLNLDQIAQKWLK